ncbi:MAG TPA: ABC transporter ATP-binding protein [Actinomycetota bacterium]|nr:ABC transporter ATP-binding protein [Actinomycetota bacterium]
MPRPRSVKSKDVVVTATGLTKRFDDLVAVDGIDFEVRKGEAFGFLGPNGAGKTSTMKMIGCTSPPSGGALRVLGMDPIAQASEVKARIGVVPQMDNLDIELTVRENLEVYASFFDIPKSEAAPRIDELLDFVQLTEKSSSKVEPLSGGMKRRLTIARALINQPDLLLLDEPTTGLDPQARHLLWDRLYRLKQRGVTLIVTTHYMDEAEQLCDRLVVMEKAQIVAEGSPRSLIERFSTPEVVELRLEDDARAELEAVATKVAERIEVLPDRVLLYAKSGDAVLGKVHKRGIETESALVRRATLEDVFLTITGRSLIE